MKASEILAALPQWAKATPEELAAAPAWTMPCRLGETPCMMRMDAIRPADTLDIAILLEDEPHVLSLVDTPRFADLHRIWPSRADVPDPVLLALVEKECPLLLQLVENMARRQLKIEGIAKGDDANRDRFCARISAEGEELLSFAITASPSLVRTLGKITFIDASHPSVGGTALAAVRELASFAVPAADISSLGVGDALLLPEIGTSAPRLIVDGKFLMDASGVSMYRDDGLIHVFDTESLTVSLGDVIAHAGEPTALKSSLPRSMRLVVSGKTVAYGHLESIAGQNAFTVEKTAD